VDVLAASNTLASNADYDIIATGIIPGAGYLTSGGKI
jgi:hypothetical protein